ncbi:MAG: hypothetical protein EBT73_03730 [Actinobacteria bacterium]|nr:hypothetical protein [Actinomycetota bacterium]NBR76444.1 hypothetical protein [Actinomycetota bacterium]NCY08782.1 hypothetical protein [Actinomycetota bacterium]
MTTDLRTRLGAPTVRAPLPVVAPLAPLFGEGGLVRGRTVACTGDAALSTALALSAAATRAGSWLAVVGVPNLGVAAAIEAGVAVERIVLAQPPRASREWVATVAALVEGFEVLIVAPPASLSASDARRLQTRVMARQAVLIVVVMPTSTGETSVFTSDIDVHADTVAWSGIERGAAHITQRTVQVRVNGRRCSSPREQTITLPC